MRSFFIKRLAVMISVVIISVMFPVIYASADEYDTITESDIENYKPEYVFPDNMKGICITPTIDFVPPRSDGSGYTEEEIYSELDRLYSSLREYSINTVIIRTDIGGVPLYGDDINDGINKTIIEYAAEEAFERGFFVYLSFNIGTALEKIGGENDFGKKLDKLALTLRNFTIRYNCDGIILEGYYSYNSTDSFRDYMASGSGIGYENWLRESTGYIFSTASEAVRRTGSTCAVGIAVDDIWADTSYTENGTDVKTGFQSLRDGYSDTLGYVKDGLADFIVLRTKGALSYADEPFETVVSWWDNAASEADIPLFVRHENEYVCTGQYGWDYPDELVKQVISAEKKPSCRGSIFSSYASLAEDRQQSTEALVRNYRGDLYLGGLENELEMTLPETTEFRTDNSSVIFAGSFDPNFTVYFQGEPVELNKAGRFYFNMELDIGKNVFTFENKGRTVTYTITRTLHVLRNAEPRGEDIYTDGGSEISFSAVAYKGSAVTALINGENIRLAEAEGLSDDIDPNSSYTRFTGTYKLPEGAVGKVTDLGNVRIYGSYPTKDGRILECITGSRIFINEKPKPLSEIRNIESIKAAAGGLISVDRDNTVCYRASNSSTVPSPDNSRLPAGTLDYVTKTVRYNGTEYYITASGRRIRTADASAVQGEISKYSPVGTYGAGVINGDTYIIFDLKNKVPFSVEYGGFTFGAGANGSYYISSFSADRICIVFDYISEVTTGNVLFPEGAVFTEGRWDTVTENGMTKHRLILRLSKKGAYDGVTASYTENGQLALLFNGTDRSLSGTTIVIDPGHGYIGGGKFDPGAVGHVREQEINLAVAKLLERKLRNAGANVIRYHTESENYVTSLRAETARQYKPDLYIAVHCNSGSSSGTGAEAYYFTPFSQPLADRLSHRLGTVLTAVHNDGRNYDRGEKYNYFYVTQQQEFPSVLAETAFVSNYTEAMALADPMWQDRFAEALFLGIQDYLTGR